jgi:hypothetical protein
MSERPKGEDDGENGDKHLNITWGIRLGRVGDLERGSNALEL